MAEKKKHRHIENKEKGDELSDLLGDAFAAVNNTVHLQSTEELFNSSNKDIEGWNKAQTARLNAFRNKINKTIDIEKKALKTAIDKKTNELNFTTKQKKSLNKTINAGFERLGALALQNHKETIYKIYSDEKIVRQSVKAKELFNVIQSRVNHELPNYSVVYKDGKKFKFESYMEMKVRTEIQNEITNTLLDDAIKSEQVFYTCSHYGNCADDHVEMQELGLFYNERWSSFDLPDDIKDEIQNFIDSNKLISVQDAVGERGNYFTTRPNCRHYFQELPLDEVLTIKSKKDLNKARDEYGLNFAGSYKPEKYNALNEQRYNERNIRHWKEITETNEIALDAALKQNMPQDEITKLKSQIQANEEKVRYWQARQRNLMNGFDKNGDPIDSSGNVRSYTREKINHVRGNLGAKRK